VMFDHLQTDAVLGGVQRRLFPGVEPIS